MRAFTPPRTRQRWIDLARHGAVPSPIYSGGDPCVTSDALKRDRVAPDGAAGRHATDEILSKSMIFSRMRLPRRGHDGSGVIIHLIDGTYELFRHFYGLRRFNKGQDKPYAAVAGVLGTILQMLEEGATHLGVATDHVIESFRNGLWPDYKTGAGIERALWAQFHPLEEALAAMGVVVWPMVEFEADDALAAAAHRVAKSK